LVYLKGIKSLNLRWNENITDKGLVHLKGINNLNLNRATTIRTDGSAVFDE
jgi:hypothetical protein